MVILSTHNIILNLIIEEKYKKKYDQNLCLSGFMETWQAVHIRCW